jgi:hypothetical protein
MDASALMITTVLVALTNQYVFRSFYGAEFRGRFTEAKRSLRERMLQANMEMEERLRGRIGAGEEPEELVQFGELWRKRLAVLNTLNTERERMDGHIRFIYYMLLFGLMHAALHFVYPGTLVELAGFSVEPATIGWGFTLFASALLIMYHVFYRRLDVSLRETERGLMSPP